MKFLLVTMLFLSGAVNAEEYFKLNKEGKIESKYATKADALRDALIHPDLRIVRADEVEVSNKGTFRKK